MCLCHTVMGGEGRRWDRMGEVLKLNSPKRVAITCKFAFTGKSLIEWVGNMDETQISNVFPPIIIAIKMIKK